MQEKFARILKRINIVYDNESCWEWNGYCNNHGYGKTQFKRNGVWKPEYVQRVVYFYITGSWPTRFVLHRCDNPRCCRPSHLFTGSQADNMRDAVSKGRMVFHNSRKTHCRRGHKFTDETTYLHADKRHCKLCKNE